MADKKKNDETVEETDGAPVFPVAADKDALIGENTEVREVQADVNDQPVAAQKMGEPADRVTEVPVYEVFVTTDERVDYVIVPPEGRGDATLPIHAYVNAETVEDVFDRDGQAPEDDSKKS
jgi:hypothetical protein